MGSLLVEIESNNQQYMWIFMIYMTVPQFTWLDQYFRKKNIFYMVHSPWSSLRISWDYVYYCGIRWLKFSIWFFHNISIKYEMLTGFCLFLEVIMIIIWPLRSSFHRYVHLVCDQWRSYDHWYMTVTIDHLTGNFSRKNWYHGILTSQNWHIKYSHFLTTFDTKRGLPTVYLWNNRRLSTLTVFGVLHFGWP